MLNATEPEQWPMRPDHPTSPRSSTARYRIANVAAGLARPPGRVGARIASTLCGDTRWLFGLLAILCVSPSALAEDSKDLIYCMWATAGAHAGASWDTFSYTGVFAGDFYGSREELLNTFHEYLEGNDWESRRYSHGRCSFEDTREKAEDRLLADANEKEGLGWRVVYTKWTPGGGESDASELAEQPIRDFTVSIGGTEPYTEQGAFGTSWTVDPNVLSICVRDHECEDGDKVAVTVSGNVLLAVEIAADWQCEDVRLGPGTHAIELRAVNGTGFKGECSHADVNTGEIMVASDREDSVQRWRHRGGTGSSARLKVTLE